MIKAKPKSSALAVKMPKSNKESEYGGSQKGVAGLIKIRNVNLIVKKPIPVSELTLDDKPEFSRGDRKEIAKQNSRKRYEKLHAQGKTTQAKADLTRLALIKEQRADAAAKREAESQKKPGDEKKTSGKAQQKY